MVPPPKHYLQHLPLMVLTGHYAWHQGETTSVPRRSQPSPGSGNPTCRRHSLGRLPHGQGMPHPTRHSMGPGSYHITHGRTPCPNSASAAPQLLGPTQSPKRAIFHFANPLNLPWSKFRSPGTNSHQGCLKINSRKRRPRVSKRGCTLWP